MKSEIRFGNRVTLHFGDADGFYSSDWGSRKRPKINWGTPGPVALHEAETFARAILRAVKRGKALKETK